MNCFCHVFIRETHKSQLVLVSKVVETAAGGLMGNSNVKPIQTQIFGGVSPEFAFHWHMNNAVGDAPLGHIHNNTEMLQWGLVQQAEIGCNVLILMRKSLVFVYVSALISKSSLDIYINVFLCIALLIHPELFVSLLVFLIFVSDVC